MVKLVKRLAGPEVRLVAAYEAGPMGYVLHRQLLALGVESSVVAPSLIPTRPGDRIKTDRRDSLKLARLLRSGDLTPVWIPDEEHEGLRGLVRARADAKVDQLRAHHLKAAGFPVHKTLDEFKVAQSSVPQATFDYVASLEWIRATENLCLVGPAGTGKSHLLVAVGHAAVAAGLRVRYFVAADLVETLYRGMCIIRVKANTDSGRKRHSFRRNPNSRSG